MGGVFEVAFGEDVFICVARKKIRHAQNEILVGDNVAVQKITKTKGTIEELLPRKNRLIRPVAANIDQVCLVTAPMPPADFLLADKILINCLTEKISVVLVINKCEAASEHFFERVKSNYANLVDGLVIVSAHKNKGIDELKEALSGKITCFAGQSGVGKTSILNIIMPQYKGETGAISKISRGKNTTRHTQLFAVGKDSFVLDTPGFSLLETGEGVTSGNLYSYYGDFAEFGAQCKFKTCTHTAEPGCAVKKAVEDGRVCPERYERYLDLFKELKDKERTMY